MAGMRDKPETCRGMCDRTSATTSATRGSRRDRSGGPSQGVLRVRLEARLVGDRLDDLLGLADGAHEQEGQLLLSAVVARSRVVEVVAGRFGDGHEMPC